MIDLPIKFDQLVKMPGDGGGTGYPYRISARDLMTNFEYAALDADDSWIESTGTSTGQGRKLKLPAVPGGGETQNLSCPFPVWHSKSNFQSAPDEVKTAESNKIYPFSLMRICLLFVFAAVFPEILKEILSPVLDNIPAGNEAVRIVPVPTTLDPS